MSHYFHTPDGPANFREVQLRFWDTDWAFTTTAVLPREPPPPAHARRLLALGCG